MGEFAYEGIDAPVTRVGSHSTHVRVLEVNNVLDELLELGALPRCLDVRAEQPGRWCRCRRLAAWCCCHQPTWCTRFCSGRIAESERTCTTRSIVTRNATRRAASANFSVSDPAIERIGRPDPRPRKFGEPSSHRSRRCRWPAKPRPFEQRPAQVLGNYHQRPQRTADDIRVRRDERFVGVRHRGQT